MSSPYSDARRNLLEKLLRGQAPLGSPTNAIPPRDPNEPVPLSYSAWGTAERTFWDAKKLEQRANFWKPRLAGAGRLWDAPDAAKAAWPPRLLLFRCPSAKGITQMTRSKST